MADRRTQSTGADNDCIAHTAPFNFGRCGRKAKLVEDVMHELCRDTDQAAYDRGAVASGQGRKGEDNPYSPGTPEYKLWEHGYLDGQKAGHRQ